MRTVLALSIALLCGACWSPGAADRLAGPIPLQPAAGAVEGWVVSRFDLPAPPCPDGAPPSLLLAHPEAGGALPVALVLHDGAFDAVFDAEAGRPLIGDHLAAPSRLSAEWAHRKAWALLGMADDGQLDVADDGALALALAEHEIALAIPTGCWGDLWHGAVGAEPTGRENDLEADGFERQGFAAAVAAWQAVHGPEAALPVEPDLDLRPLVGLGTGGRGVAELLHAGVDADIVAVDASPDDLSAWRGDGPWTDHALALDRVFPAGDEGAGALSTAPLPERTAYLWSSLDPSIPVDAHRAARAAVTGLSGGVVRDTAIAGHVAVAGDLDEARWLAAWLLDPEPSGSGL